MANNFTFTSTGNVGESSTQNTNLVIGFRLTVSGKTATVSLITRNPYAGGSSYTYRGGDVANTITINGTTKSITDGSGGGYDYNVSVGTSWVELTSTRVSFTLDGGANGNYQKSISYSLDWWSFGDTSGTITISAGIIPSSEYYTACTAPTTVTASGYIAPGNNLSVSWSGASGGTNNSIVGYTVYYTITSNGTLPTTSTATYVTSSTTSVNIPIPSSATRGYYIRVGVVTRGSAGSAYYSSIKTGGTAAVNRLPSAPSLNKTTQYFPNGGGSVSVTPTAGSDNDSQSYSVYYNTSTSSSTATKLTTTSLTVSVSSNTTYYFWTNDGVEFSSSYSTFSAIKNSTKPSVSFNGAPTINTKTSSKLTSGSYVVGLSNIKATLGKSTYANAISNTGTLTMQIRYQTISGTSDSTVQIQSTAVGNVTAYTLNNITNTLSQIGMDKKFKIRLRLYDGLDYSDWVEYPSSSWYYTAPAPTITAFYNQYANENISGFNNYIYNKGRVVLTKDTNFTTATLNYKRGTQTGSSIVTLVQDTNTEYFNFTVDPSGYYGNTFQITSVTLSDGTYSCSITPSSTLQKTFILLPTLSNLQGISTYKPYTTTGTSNISVGIGSLTQSNCAAYGLNSINDITFQMKYGTKYYNVSNKCGTYNISSSTLSTSLTLNGLYPPHLNGATGYLGFPDIYGSYTYQLVARITNVFGYSTETSVNCIINFSENPAITNFILKVDDDNGVPVNTSIALQENMQIYYSYQAQSYNQGQVSNTLQYSLDNVNWINISNDSYTFGINSESDNIMTSTTITGTWIVPTFSTSDSTYFRIVNKNMTTGYEGGTSTNIETKRNKILPATANISASVSSGGTMVDVIIQSDTIQNNSTLQTSNYITYEEIYSTQIYADTSNNPSTTKLDPPNSQAWYNGTTVTYPSLSFASTAKFLNIKITTTRTINQYYIVENDDDILLASTTQIITSNIYAYYNEIPTVSYRKNRIIINNASPELSTDILAIHALSSDQNQVRLIGVGGFSDGIVTITLASGPSIMTSISNILIDGGVWA